MAGALLSGEKAGRASLTSPSACCAKPRNSKIFFPISLFLSVVGVGFFASAGLTAPPRSLAFRWRKAVSERGHFSPAMAKVTWPNGDSRTLSFEGVGCEISMC
jgi:hypothetical protein